MFFVSKYLLTYVISL